MGHRLLGVVALACTLVGAFCAGALAQSYFSLTTGNEWRSYTELERLVYITGYLDAIGAVEFAHKTNTLGPFGARMSSQIKCLTDRKIPVGQVYEVVRKWMQDNPDKWDFRMSLIMLDSLRRLCP